MSDTTWNTSFSKTTIENLENPRKSKDPVVRLDTNNISVLDNIYNNLQNLQNNSENNDITEQFIASYGTRFQEGARPKKITGKSISSGFNNTVKAIDTKGKATVKAIDKSAKQTGKSMGIKKTPPPKKPKKKSKKKKKSTSSSANDRFNNAKNQFMKYYNIVSEIIVGIVTAFPATINTMVNGFSTVYVTALSENNKPNNSDVTTVSNIIYLIISFPLCVFITYNWFFMLVYREQTADGFERIPKNGTRLNISFDSNWQLKFLFEYVITPLRVFDTFLFSDKGFTSIDADGDEYTRFSSVPQLLDRLPFKIIAKFLLFGISFAFFFVMDPFNGVASSIKGLPTMLTGVCTAIIIMAWFYNSVNTVVDNIPKILTATFITCISLFIYIVIQLCIAIFSINPSTITLLLYLWFHSIGAVFFYGSGGMQYFNKMDKFVKADLDFLNKDENCNKDNPFINMILYFANFLYNNFYSFGFILLLLRNVFSCLMHLKSNMVKMSTATITMFLILFTTVYGIMYGSGSSKTAGAAPNATPYATKIPDATPNYPANNEVDIVDDKDINIDFLKSK
jgi:hypothetical protein